MNVPIAPLAFEGIRVRYPGARQSAVDGVTFDAPAGMVTAVTGPNGSGKSTLVRALLRRVRVEAGRIAIGGSALETLGPRVAARRVAVVPQREEPAFPLTVREYIALGRFPHSGTWHGTTRLDRAAIDAAVERSGVANLLGRRTDELSGGEWQRVRVGRALAQEGEALVLDEPTTFLDVGHEMAVFELLADLARGGMAVLLITHQLNLVARFAHTVVLLHDGRVAAVGPPADVMVGSILEPVYEWPLVIVRDSAVGAPMLIPLRSGAPHRP